MREGIHPNGQAQQGLPEHTGPQLDQDLQRLLARLCVLLQPVPEQLHTAPAGSPETRLGEFLWSVPDQPAGAAPGRPALGGLTAQEWRIAQLIAQGLSTAAIAAQLYIAPTTVKVHRRHIRKKLGLVGSQHRLQPYLARQEQAAAR